LNLREAFAKAKIYPSIHSGEVWKAKDSVISLIDALTRHWHEERHCVVLSNEDLCSDANWPIVLIAPLSSSLHPLAKTDLIVDKTDRNGLDVPSRVILSHLQPIRKEDLQEKVGEISRSKWEAIIRRVFWHIDRA